MTLEAQMTQLELSREPARLNLHCRFGKFVDSVTNRNASLDYADNVPVEYLILLNAGEKYICEHMPLIKNRSKLRVKVSEQFVR